MSVLKNFGGVSKSRNSKLCSLYCSFSGAWFLLSRLPEVLNGGAHTHFKNVLKNVHPNSKKPRILVNLASLQRSVVKW